MKKNRLLAFVLAVLMAFGCIAALTFSASAATYVSMPVIKTAKDKSLASSAAKPFSGTDTQYTAATADGMIYQHADGKDGSGNKTYFDQYSLGNIKVSDTRHAVFVFYYRTDTQASFQWNAYNTFTSGGSAVTTNRPYGTINNAYTPDEEWHLLYVDMDFSTNTSIDYFYQAHLKFMMPAGGYVDVAGYGVFSSMADAVAYCEDGAGNISDTFRNNFVDATKATLGGFTATTPDGSKAITYTATIDDSARTAVVTLPYGFPAVDGVGPDMEYAVINGIGTAVMTAAPSYSTPGTVRVTAPDGATTVDYTVSLAVNTTAPADMTYQLTSPVYNNGYGMVWFKNNTDKGISATKYIPIYSATEPKDDGGNPYDGQESSQAGRYYANTASTSVEGYAMFASSWNVESFNQYRALVYIDTGDDGIDVSGFQPQFGYSSGLTTGNAASKTFNSVNTPKYDRWEYIYYNVPESYYGVTQQPRPLPFGQYTANKFHNDVFYLGTFLATAAGATETTPGDPYLAQYQPYGLETTSDTGASDGTIFPVTDDMEIRLSGTTAWQAVTDLGTIVDGVLTGVPGGIYDVRYAADYPLMASDSVEVNVGTAGSVTISFDPQNGDAVTSVPVALDAAITFPTVSKGGYTFLFWGDTADATVATSDTTAQTDKTYYAIYEVTVEEAGALYIGAGGSDSNPGRTHEYPVATFTKVNELLAADASINTVYIVGAFAVHNDTSATITTYLGVPDRTITYQGYGTGSSLSFTKPSGGKQSNVELKGDIVFDSLALSTDSGDGSFKLKAYDFTVNDNCSGTIQNLCQQSYNTITGGDSTIKILGGVVNNFTWGSFSSNYYEGVVDVTIGGNARVNGYIANAKGWQSSQKFLGKFLVTMNDDAYVKTIRLDAAQHFYSDYQGLRYFTINGGTLDTAYLTGTNHYKGTIGSTAYDQTESTFKLDGVTVYEVNGGTINAFAKKLENDGSTRVVIFNGNNMNETLKVQDTDPGAYVVTTAGDGSLHAAYTYNSYSDCTFDGFEIDSTAAYAVIDGTPHEIASDFPDGVISAAYFTPGTPSTVAFSNATAGQQVIFKNGEDVIDTAEFYEGEFVTTTAAVAAPADKVFIGWNEDAAANYANDYVITSVSATPITLYAIFVNKGERVIYVNKNALTSGNGSTAASAWTSLTAAIAALEVDGGTIVLCGDAGEATSGLPKFTNLQGRLVITGNDGVTDFAPTLSFRGWDLANNANASAWNGSVVLENLKLFSGNLWSFINAQGVQLEFGEGISMAEGSANLTYRAAGEDTIQSFGKKQIFRGGKFSAIKLAGKGQATFGDIDAEFWPSTSEYAYPVDIGNDGGGSGNSYATVANVKVLINADVSAVRYSNLDAITGTSQIIFNKGIDVAVTGAPTSGPTGGEWKIYSSADGDVAFTATPGTYTLDSAKKYVYVNGIYYGEVTDGLTGLAAGTYRVTYSDLAFDGAVLTGAGYTAASETASEKAYAIIASFAVSGYNDVTIANFGAYYYNSDNEEAAITATNVTELETAAGRFYVVVYDIPDVTTEVIVKPFATIGETAFFGETQTFTAGGIGADTYYGPLSALIDYYA